MEEVTLKTAFLASPIQKLIPWDSFKQVPEKTDVWGGDLAFCSVSSRQNSEHCHHMVTVAKDSYHRITEWLELKGTLKII